MCQYNDAQLGYPEYRNGQGFDTNFDFYDLQDSVEEVNRKLEEAGSVYSYKVSERNDYVAIDRYRGDVLENTLDCNEPMSVLDDRLQDDYEYYLNQKAV